MRRGAPLRRTPFKAKAAVQVKRERAPLVLVPRAEPSRAVMALVLPKPTAKPVLKTPDRKNQAIRDSARDEDCLIRLPGCPSDPRMTIWSHNRHARAGKGGRLKAICLNGAYGCTHCDAIYDGNAPRPAGWTAEMVDLAWYHAHAESLVKLKQKGLV